MVYSKVFVQKNNGEIDLKVENTPAFKIQNQKVVKHTYPTRLYVVEAHLVICCFRLIVREAET
jgi:hypothetical protein